jgi:hypothetical protein
VRDALRPVEFDALMRVEFDDLVDPRDVFVDVRFVLALLVLDFVWAMGLSLLVDVSSSFPYPRICG